MVKIVAPGSFSDISLHVSSDEEEKNKSTRITRLDEYINSEFFIWFLWLRTYTHIMYLKNAYHLTFSIRPWKCKIKWIPYDQYKNRKRVIQVLFMEF